MSNNQMLFLCSLPGAGGMLLQAILSQNPAFCTLGHSPLFEIFHSISSLGRTVSEDSQISCDHFIGNILEGLLEGAGNFASNKILIDKTGSGPLAYFDLLQQISPGTKIILFTRDLRAQVSNLLLRLVDPRLHLAFTSGALMGESAVMQILQEPLMDLGIRRITEFVHSKLLSKIFIVSYEQLCLAPDATLSLLYDFLEIAKFKHSFENIAQPNPDLCFGPLQYQALVRPVLKSTNYRWPAILSQQASNYVLRTYKHYFSVLYTEALTSNPFNIKEFASSKLLKSLRT